MDTRKLEILVQAYNIVSSTELPEHEAREQLAKATEARRWLEAERSWGYRIREWLEAEGRYSLRRLVLDDPMYAAGRRGWTAVKKYVSALDGVREFEQLPDSLQFRYAAFAAGVLGALPPPEVKSTKQISREIASDDAIPRFNEGE